MMVSLTIPEVSFADVTIGSYLNVTWVRDVPPVPVNITLRQYIPPKSFNTTLTIGCKYLQTIFATSLLTRAFESCVIERFLPMVRPRIALAKYLCNPNQELGLPRSVSDIRHKRQEVGFHSYGMTSFFPRT